jgi:predicted DNA-binding transcriptional regulator AlpA
MPKSAPSTKPKRFLRKASLAERYGVNKRTVDRMVVDGRIPPPRYLPGSTLPMWEEGELEANERKAALKRAVA